jgi:3-carboxy-cis,cis-muconate cycloisomerase
MAAAVSDEAWVTAMLEVEAALAATEAELGLIPGPAADAIAATVRRSDFDVAAIGEQAASSATPVLPLVRALKAAVSQDAAAFVHWGATSQDILDTAMMLVARRALDRLLSELWALEEACAGQAERHKGTLMAGRTLLQQALPITFGLKAAGWLSGVLAAEDAVLQARERLAVQLGGAAGTLASFGERGPELVSGLSRRLGLPAPLLPWHSERSRVAMLGAALAVAAGSAGKIAVDVALLMQTEVAEVSEAKPGASSAMPHKRNPVTAVEIDAAVRGAQAQVAVLMGAMRAEHERAAGSWQAEWTALSEALRLAGGAVARAAALVAGLHVDQGRMRANLELTGGLILSEQLVSVLAAAIGRSRADEVVAAAVQRALDAGRPFRDEVGADPEITRHLSQERVAAALEPESWVGSAPALVDALLAAHRARRGSGR